MVIGRWRHGVLWTAFAAGLAGCGADPHSPPQSGIPRALLLESRPIGHGPRFRPAATGPVSGSCRTRLGPRSGVHVEVFAANRVVIVPAGIGTVGPRTLSEGRIAHARCYGELVTLEPTGVVLVRAGFTPRLSSLFTSWGQPLSRRRLTGFTAGPRSQVRAFVDGRRWRGSPQRIPLRRHAEIVLEVGAFVPPHHTYTFPPGS